MLLNGTLASNPKDEESQGDHSSNHQAANKFGWYTFNQRFFILVQSTILVF